MKELKLEITIPTVGSTNERELLGRVAAILDEGLQEYSVDSMADDEDETYAEELGIEGSTLTLSIGDESTEVCL